MTIEGRKKSACGVFTSQAGIHCAKASASPKETGEGRDHLPRGAEDLLQVVSSLLPSTTHHGCDAFRASKGFHIVGKAVSCRDNREVAYHENRCVLTVTESRSTPLLYRGKRPSE